MLEQMTLPVGATVRGAHGERYTVEAVLGVGGFSAVYKVRDRRIKERVFALKEVINPNTQDKNNLATEALLLMRLQHSSLTRVYQVFEHVQLNRIYLLMDYIEGKTLDVLYKEQPDKRFSLDMVQALMSPVVKAVSYLHNQQPPIVHRDIKPANIIIPVKADDAILVDFGLAKEYVEEKTTNVLRYGTPGYAAPEQYIQGTNLHTDIYGLGATLYTLLTGVRPPDALLRMVNNENKDPLERADLVCPAVPISVGKVLLRAMNLRSERRFTSVDEFWEAFCFATAYPDVDIPDAATVSSVPLPTLAAEDTRNLDGSLIPKKRPRRLAVLFTLIALIVLILGIEGYFLWAAANTHRYTQTPQSATPTSVVRPTASVVANVCEPSQNPPQDSEYPLLSPCYAGTVNDIGVANGNTGLFLTDLKQQKSTFTGRFRGLNVIGDIEGTIKPDGSIRFVVKPVGKSDTIVFTGGPKYGGDMRGEFTIYDKNGKPSMSEYGDWNMHPVSALTNK